MIDTEQVRQIVLSSLPCKSRWPITDSSLDFSFSHSEVPLRSIEVPDSYKSIDPAWRLLFVFGELGYADWGGEISALCVAARGGQVLGLTSDRDRPVFQFNRNIEAFVRTFQLLDNAIQSGAICISELVVAAETIDPATFPSSEWSDMLRELPLNQRAF